MSIGWHGDLAEQLDAHWRSRLRLDGLTVEALHHGAEIALLRDLFRWQPGAA
jgi:hypothetical protein